MTTLQKYLLQNQISDSSFNNSNTKQYLIEKMTGGKYCAGQNTFKYTIQKYNDNQKTLQGDLLQGGRISMPAQYFGAKNSQYKPTVQFSKISTLTPTLAKQALPSSQFGGSSKIKDINIFLKNSIPHDHLHKAEQDQLLHMYQSNLNKFIHNVKTLSGGTITKNSINQALKELKN